ncbi:MAG TPA: hypothetical protein VGI22_12910 [Xanthobacteraceae bacterium]|jgi:hypothetical protein
MATISRMPHVIASRCGRGCVTRPARKSGRATARRPPAIKLIDLASTMRPAPSIEGNAPAEQWFGNSAAFEEKCDENKGE